MFLIKQVGAQVGAVLATPLAIALLLGVAAVAVATRGRRRTTHCLLVLAAALAYLGAIVPVGDALLRPLEHRYPPLTKSDRLPVVNCVVVLGSGYAPRDEIPITAALDEDGLVRIVEGVRMLRQLGSARLIVSGGASADRGRPAQGYAELARALGVRNESLVISDTALDTGDEARAITALLGTTPFILVTSAYHMPRAMWQMKRAGARPIPGPTGQLVDRPTDWRDWLPSSGGLGRTERALHEYLGLVALAAHIG